MIDLGIVIRLVDDETDPDVGHVVYDVIEPESGYLVERFHDLMKAVTFAAVPTCQHIDWVRDEYAMACSEPELGIPLHMEIPCGGNATTRIEYVDDYARHWGVDQPEVVYVCDDHAAEFRQTKDDPYPLEIVSDGPLPVRDLA